MRIQEKKHRELSGKEKRRGKNPNPSKHVQETRDPPLPLQVIADDARSYKNNKRHGEFLSLPLSTLPDRLCPFPVRSCRTRRADEGWEAESPALVWLAAGLGAYFPESCILDLRITVQWHFPVRTLLGGPCTCIARGRSTTTTIHPRID